MRPRYQQGDLPLMLVLAAQDRMLKKSQRIPQGLS